MSHVKVHISSHDDMISSGPDLISVYGMLIRGMALHHTITKVNYKNKIKFNLRNNSCSPNVLTMLDSVSRSFVFVKPKVFISRPNIPEVSHEIHAICLPRSSFKICLNRKCMSGWRVWKSIVMVWWTVFMFMCDCVVPYCHAWKWPWLNSINHAWSNVWFK